MNKSVTRLLQDFKEERIMEAEKLAAKRKKLDKGIAKSTNKAYLLVWKSVLEQYKLDLQSKSKKDNYFVAINMITLNEMLYLAKRKLVRANVKYLEELKEYSESSSKNIVGAEIDYEVIDIVFPDKLIEYLEKDNFQLVGNNAYGITASELEQYIENSNKKNSKSRKRKTSYKK